MPHTLVLLLWQQQQSMHVSMLVLVLVVAVAGHMSDILLLLRCQYHHGCQSASDAGGSGSSSS
jgi:hypothetical protein